MQAPQKLCEEPLPFLLLGQLGHDVFSGCLRRRSAASSVRSTLLGEAGWHRGDFAEARTLDDGSNLAQEPTDRRGGIHVVSAVEVNRRANRNAMKSPGSSKGCATRRNRRWRSRRSRCDRGQRCPCRCDACVAPTTGAPAASADGRAVARGRARIKAALRGRLQTWAIRCGCNACHNRATHRRPIRRRSGRRSPRRCDIASTARRIAW